MNGLWTLFEADEIVNTFFVGINDEADFREVRGEGCFADPGESIEDHSEVMINDGLNVGA